MIKHLLTLSIFIIFLGIQTETIGQNSGLTAENIEEIKSSISNIVNYYGETLTFLGDTTTVQRERDIVINDTYLKVFQNSKVQIEDDLIEDRDVPLYKDVQAYLKDVNFFYKFAEFNYEVQDIEYFEIETGKWIFTVTANRSLYGDPYSGDTVNNQQLRYIEINLDELSGDLKIASIYTTKLNKKVEIVNWWSSLNDSWRNFFAADSLFSDSIPINSILSFSDSTLILQKDSLRFEKIETLGVSEIVTQDSTSNTAVDIDTLIVTYRDTILYNSTPLYRIIGRFLKASRVDISDQEGFISLEPLSKFSDLKTLICKNTQISSILPLRNLNKLEELDISGSPIKDLSPLKTSISLSEIILNSTEVEDLSPLEKLPKLEIIHFTHTKIKDISPLSGQKKLRDLRFTYSPVTSLQPIASITTLEIVAMGHSDVANLTPINNLHNITILGCNNTRISDLSPLLGLKNLELLYIENSNVNNLAQIENLHKLKYIYCDNTNITEDIAKAFMENHPGCLVVYESEKLQHWWQTLPKSWKSVFNSIEKLDSIPTREQLHQLTKIANIDIEGDNNIKSLEPVEPIMMLSKLNFSNTTISDLSPISNLIQLTDLQFSNTSVFDLSPLSNLDNLKKIECENTEVSNLEPLIGIGSLELILADGSGIKNSTVDQLREKNHNTLVVYNSEKNQNWWNMLDPAWQEIFLAKYQFNQDLNIQQLQTIVNTEELKIEKNSRIHSLDPLSELRNLKRITVNGTAINTVSYLTKLKRLTYLDISDNPVEDITPVAEIRQLDTLIIRNTPTSKMDAVSDLIRLKNLDISGTQIKSIKPLENLINLQVLDLHNTRISKLSPLMHLEKLKSLIIYNTKISQKRVDEFKNSHQQCNTVFY